jgi:hypothetical protein
MSYPDAGIALFRPLHAVAAVVSSTDFDCVAGFPAGYATEIHVGGAGSVAVMYLGDTVAVTLAGCSAGSSLFGCFKTILHTGTTATSLVAKGF